MSRQSDAIDAEIGRRLQGEYKRQLATFRENNPQWAHLENPSWDFGSATVKEIIDRANDHLDDLVHPR